MTIRESSWKTKYQPWQSDIIELDENVAKVMFSFKGNGKCYIGTDLWLIFIFQGWEMGNVPIPG